MIAPSPSFKANSNMVSNIWSPGKTTPHEPHRIRTTSENERPSATVAAPIWTPPSSPTSERKQFRPVNFQSPTLRRKKVEFAGETVLREAPPTPPPPPPPVARTAPPPPKRPTSIVVPPMPVQSVNNPQERVVEVSIVAPGSPPQVRTGQGDFGVESPEVKTFQKRKVEGIGPTTREGMPLVLRSEVRDSNQSKWYKKMYDTIHKQKKHNDEYVTIRYKQKRSKYPYTSGYLSEPETSVSGGYASAPDYAFDDENYEKRESFASTGRSRPQYYFVPQQDTPMTRLMKESGYESDSTLIFSKNKESVGGGGEGGNVPPPLSPQEQKNAYKVIQKGGDVPLYGLRKPAPERPKGLFAEFLQIERELFMQKSIEKHSTIVCYPVTIVSPPSTITRTPPPPKKVSVCVPKPPQIGAPSPPKRQSSRNNRTLRMISAPQNKRHSGCYATAQPNKNPRLISNPNKQPPASTIIKKTAKTAPPNSITVKKNSAPKKVQKSPARGAKKQKPAAVSRSEAPVTLPLPPSPPPETRALAKKTAVRRRRSLPPGEPTFGAIRIYLENSRPVSGSRFVFLDKFRSKSLSPARLKSPPPPPPPLPAPPIRKLFFSQTSRPSLPLVQASHRASPELFTGTGRDFILCECVLFLDPKRVFLRGKKWGGKIALNRFYEFRDLNELYFDLERFFQLEKTMLDEARPCEAGLDYEAWRARRSRERELRDLREKLRAKQHLSPLRDLEKLKWRGERDRGLRNKQNTVDFLKKSFEKLPYAPRGGARDPAAYRLSWRPDSVAEIARKFRSKSEGRRDAADDDDDRLLTTGTGSKIWSSLSCEQVDILKRQLSDIYRTDVRTKLRPETETWTPFRGSVAAKTLGIAPEKTARRPSGAAVSPAKHVRIESRRPWNGSLGDVRSKTTLERVKTTGLSPKRDKIEPRTPAGDKTGKAAHCERIRTLGTSPKHERTESRRSFNVRETSDRKSVKIAPHEPEGSPKRDKVGSGSSGVPPKPDRNEVATSPQKDRPPGGASLPSCQQQHETSPSSDESSTNTVICCSKNNNSISTKVDFFESTFVRPEHVPIVHEAGGAPLEHDPKLVEYLANEPLYPGPAPPLPGFPELRRVATNAAYTFKSQVDRLRDRFESERGPKRSKSDSHLVERLRARYEFPNKFNSGRGRSRRARGVVSPAFLRAEDRFMPHINIISKIADLYRAKPIGRSRSEESFAEFFGCKSGEVEKLRGRFEAEAGGGGRGGGRGRVPPFLCGDWTAHRFPRSEDNSRSSLDDSSFLGEDYYRKRKRSGVKKMAADSGNDSPLKYQENDVTIHYKIPVRQEIKEFVEEDELAAKQAAVMRQIYEEERRLKRLREREDAQRRRHHADALSHHQKSLIPPDRYDDFDHLEAEKRGGEDVEPRLTARALYNFVGQTARELTFSKGDLIYVKRQVDKNWYEGELNAMVGLFPVSYVEIIRPESLTTHQPKRHEGQARAKYNFVAQTHLELSLAKGELVSLTKRVDPNWYEGKIGGRRGIFPVSYVEVLIEPREGAPNAAQAPDKPVASPAAHSLLLNGSAGGKESMGSHSYVPNYCDYSRDKTDGAAEAKKRGGGGGGEVRSYDPVKQPMTQALHIETQSEPVPYRALFKYLPQNEDELELWEGDTVYVLERCDDGWFVGSSERSGAFGTFPGNYVEKI